LLTFPVEQHDKTVSHTVLLMEEREVPLSHRVAH
jgi:hypothetical protein